MLQYFKGLMGSKLAATDGEIGVVREMYFEDQEWVMRYLVVETGSWLTGRQVLIAPRALGEVDAQSGTMAVNLSKDQICSAPPIETDKPISRQYEEQIYEHYGWLPHWGVPSGGREMILPTSVLTPAPESSADLQADRPAVPQGDPHLRSSEEVRGYKFHAQDSEFGHVSDFVLEDSDWRVRYLVISTHQWLPIKHVLVAPEWIEQISFSQEQVFINLPRSTIQEAPAFDPGAPISRAYEQRLHDHYERKGYWDAVHAARP